MWGRVARTWLPESDPFYARNYPRSIALYMLEYYTFMFNMCCVALALSSIEIS